jgi:hypothetical protein
MRINRNRRATLLGGFGVLVGVIALAAPNAAIAVPASLAAAAPTAAEATGWVRLGHMSPDTNEVDVRVTALRGGSTMFELSDVGYGDISPYTPLPEGTYTVAMVAAGSDDWSVPVISASITVGDHTSSTIAAYGPNSALQVKAFADDLTAPTAGMARIRVIQASTLTSTVDVRTTTGVSIAADAHTGTATPYAEVPAGQWTLQLEGEGVSDTASVDVAPGTVSTLFVLDTADGGLTILPVLDSAGTAVTPDGGVQTGGGWLARLAHRSAAGSLTARPI